MESDEFLMINLQKAHAMEKAMESALLVMAEDADNHPELRKAFRTHLKETELHTEALARRIKQLDGKVSEARGVASQIKSDIKIFSSKLSHSTNLKNLENAYAAEHNELAVYTQIQRIAELMEDDETVRMCMRIMNDEKVFAKRIEYLMPQIVGMEMAKMLDD